MPIQCTKVTTYKELLEELQKMSPEQLEEEISFKDSAKDFYEMGMKVCALPPTSYFELDAEIVKHD